MGSLLYGGPAKNCIISPNLETSFQPFSIETFKPETLKPETLKPEIYDHSPPQADTENEPRILGLTFVRRFQGFVSYILTG
jgi:hypothetical protein